VKIATAIASLMLFILGVGTACAQDNFPSRTVTLVVTQAPGGGMDGVARIVARKMSALLNQSVVVENKPGGAENIAINAVAKAAPDGYTLLLCSNSITINPSLYKSLPYDARKELRPIGKLGASPLLLVAAATEPYRTVPELVAYAKANPDKLSYGSPGTGTAHHLGMELIKSATGAPIQHVPYRGAAPGVNDLLAGTIPLLVATLSPVEPHIIAGKIRPLVTINTARVRQLDQVPSVSEVIPGLEIQSWMGMFTPAGVPDAAAAKLTDALRSTLQDAEVVTQLDRLGFVVAWSPPTELQTTMARDEVRWAAAIRDAGIKPE